MSMIGAPPDTAKNPNNRRKSSIFLNIFTFGQTAKCPSAEDIGNHNCGCTEVPQIANLDEVV